MARSRGIPCKRVGFRCDGRTTEIVVSPVRVRVSPSRVGCKTAVSQAASPDARSAQTLPWAFSGLFSAYPTARRRRNAGDPTPSAERLHARSRRDPATHRLLGPRASTARGDYEQLLASAQVDARPRGGRGARSRSTNFWILPVPVLGSSSTTSIALGTLKR